MIALNTSQKHNEGQSDGSHTVTCLNNNNTVTLTKVASNGGTISQTWNMQHVHPCMA